MTENDFLAEISKIKWLGPVEWGDKDAAHWRLGKIVHWKVETLLTYQSLGATITQGGSYAITDHEAFCLAVEHVRKKLSDKKVQFNADVMVSAFYPFALLAAAQAVESGAKLQSDKPKE